MRRVEEKTLIILEIVLLVFVTLSSVVLQISDIKIKQYNDKINLLEMRRSQYLQLAIYHTGRIEYWEISGLLSQLGSRLGKKLSIEEVPIESLEKEGKKYRELMDDYKVKKIDNQEYIGKRGNLHRIDKEYYNSQIREIQKAIKDIRSNQPKLLSFNIFCLQRLAFIIQIFGILAAIWIYALIFKEIHQRAVAKKQDNRKTIGL
jgi:ABC-type antimicrobial peptide transport system permease subunit